MIISQQLQFLNFKLTRNNLKTMKKKTKKSLLIKSLVAKVDLKNLKKLMKTQKKAKTTLILLIR